MSKLKSNGGKSCLCIEMEFSLRAVQPACHLADDHHHHVQERHGDLAVGPQQVGEALIGATGNWIKVELSNRQAQTHRLYQSSYPPLAWEEELERKYMTKGEAFFTSS